MLSTKQQLGLRIKEFRELKNFTREKLSELVGIDSKHLSRIENGRNYPSIETLEKLAYSLEISFDDLFQFSHLSNQEELLDKCCNLLYNLSYEKSKFIYKLLKEL